MGDCRSDDPAGETRWTQTLGQRARSLERDFLRALDRMPVEGAAQRPAAEEHGARLSRALELGWHGGTHPPRALRCSAPAAIIDSQTARGAQKGGLCSILQATTRARRSKVASGTSWSTHWASC